MRHQAFANELVENRQKRADLVLGIDDFDQHRQVGRRVEQAGAVQRRMAAESFDPADDGRACQSGTAVFKPSALVEPDEEVA